MTDLRAAPPAPAASVQRRWSRLSRSTGSAWIWVAAVGLFALCATVSIRLHLRVLSTGYDLGIYEQAVRSWAHWHWPTVELEGPGANQLGDHFAPILALIGPVYRVFPSAITLLVVQSAALAVAVVPVARFAQRCLGRPAAVVVALGYGLSWGIAETVGFDFHEICLAVPLTAFSAVALAERRYRAAVLWALPLLAVSEDLGLTLAAVGALVIWGGRRRLGLATVLAGLVGTALEIAVAIPRLTRDGTLSAWEAQHHVQPLGRGGLEATLERLTYGLFTPDVKVTLLLTVFAPTALVALRSPLVLLAVPTLGWRLTSVNPFHWTTGFHYSANLMPIVFVAFVDGLTRLRTSQGGSRVREALTISAVVTAILLPAHPFWTLVQPSTWGHDARAADAHAMLRQIPDGVTVAASNRLVPQLTARDQVTVFGVADSRPDPEYLAIEDSYEMLWPFDSLADQHRLKATAFRVGYVKVFGQGNFVLLHRGTTAGRFPPTTP